MAIGARIGRIKPENNLALTMRARLFFLAAILLGSFLQTIYIAPNAQAKTYGEMTPSEDAASYTYYTVLGACVQRSMYGDINLKVGDNGNTSPSLGDDDNGAWFDPNAAWGITFTNGHHECDALIKDALQLWGWGSDYQQFLRDIGYTYQAGNNPPRWHGPGDAGNGDTRRQRFESAVQSKVYNQNFPDKPPISGAAWYEIAYNNFFASCSAKDLGLYDKLQSDTKSRVDNRTKEGTTQYTSYFIYNKDTKAAENHGFSYTPPESDSISIYGYRGYNTNDGEQLSCADLGRRMSDNTPAMALYVRKNPNYVPSTGNTSQSKLCETNPNDPSCGDSQTTCAVEGVGWIVCPVSNFLADITDGLFNVLTLLLSTSPMGTDNPTYKAWEVMRNIANVVFVIVFLIIIFSQITNVGVTNYGIKKLLPRIIVAAILVNVSYFICAIAVDLSNIIGKSVQDLLSNLSTAVSGSSTTGNNLNIWGDITGWVLAGGAAGLTVTGAVLSISAAGGILPALALLLPLLVTTLFAVLTVILVLAARQALIIILIAIAPLAFVAYLLPNTEDWFTKWRKLFMTLLLLFPIISFIFGGSQLAATIIRNGTDNPLIYLLSLAVQVVPFFLVPIIMKFSGGVLNRFGGIVNNPNKGPFDKLKKSAQSFGDTQRNAGRARQLQRYADTGRGGAVTRWQLRRKAEHSGVENVLKRAEAGYVAEQIKSDEAFRNVVAGGNALNAASPAAQQAARAGAVSALDKIRGEEVSAAKILIEDARLDSTQRQTLATTGSVEVNGMVYTGAAMQKAAIEEQMVKGSYNEKMAIIESSGTERMKAFSQTIASGARAMAAQNPGLGGKTLGMIEDGKITNSEDIRNAMFSALQEGKFTAASIADMHDNARELLISVASESTDPTHHAALTAAVDKIYSTPELSAKVAGNEKAMGQLAQLRTSGQVAGQGTFDIPRA